MNKTRLNDKMKQTKREKNGSNKDLLAENKSSSKPSTGIVCGNI